MPAKRARRRAFRIKRKDGWQNGSVLTRRYASICPHRRYLPLRQAPNMEEPWACQGVAEYASLVHDPRNLCGFHASLDERGNSVGLVEKAVCCCTRVKNRARLPRVLRIGIVHEGVAF